ncbi:unnamed protein product [Protopolystoma xenopodis]|uniref:Uncharacterized protein n=1 Tax=Protopolystoma xenopodis TaxID=117903 RepID=A0A448XFB3_9PLAT|nr:unnamed protein product [Protopolystoma xenopodis]
MKVFLHALTIDHPHPSQLDLIFPSSISAISLKAEGYFPSRVVNSVLSSTLRTLFQATKVRAASLSINSSWPATQPPALSHSNLISAFKGPPAGVPTFRPATTVAERKVDTKCNLNNSSNSCNLSKSRQSPNSKGPSGQTATLTADLTSHSFVRPTAKMNEFGASPQCLTPSDSGIHRQWQGRTLPRQESLERLGAPVGVHGFPPASASDGLTKCSVDKHCRQEDSLNRKVLKESTLDEDTDDVPPLISFDPGEPDGD